MFLDQYLNKRLKKSTSESTVRSLLKTISWRIIGTIDTMIISFLITGELEMAMAIGSIEVISKMVLYFFHERAWSKIKL